MFFNFYEGRFRDFIDIYNYDFCLVINGSMVFDDAFILPFKDFKDFFSPELLDASHRWIGNVRLDDEAIVISANGISQEKLAHEYHNAFHLLQDAPLPLPKEPDANEFI